MDSQLFWQSQNIGVICYEIQICIREKSVQPVAPRLSNKLNFELDTRYRVSQPVPSRRLTAGWLSRC